MEVIKNKQIENVIFTIRGVQLMIDFHLAELYGVETKRLNEQVKRNKKRFPNTFMFQLSQSEWDSLQPQIATTKGSASSYFSSELGETKPCIHLLYKIGKCDLKELSKRRSQNAAMRISDVNQYLWN